MNHPTPNPLSIVNAEHRGWTLQARWLQSLGSSADGWVCYATRPVSSHALNIGRWGSSELALEHGRAYVDRRAEAPAHPAAKPQVQKRRL